MRAATAVLGDPSFAAPKGDDGPGTVTREAEERLRVHLNALPAGAPRQVGPGEERSVERQGPGFPQRPVLCHPVAWDTRAAAATRSGVALGPAAVGRGAEPGSGANTTHLRARFPGLGVHRRPLPPT